ncbi:glutaredoxin-like protein NrdH [Pseudarthrobacter sp. PS3-L1]|uniref:glutaredoxin-like protein NrdH n=1 Tax=Pseudarthrobacter sp. PS3-L1 TaxID=3046207 RepID=UPI0024BB790F|nr:glutaredoxin-like protein NrdH [Pseudarthrobacter sp. PS3-L1]MDJ0322101.1 glutaredoxin-like protein NrdH [Pseudarthrobacter sp. PS3-L1]
MEPKVTVYSKPSCVQCTATYRALDAKGISYVSVDVTKAPAALEYISEELGYSQAPVVVDCTDEQNHWSGFRPDKIAGLS